LHLPTQDADQRKATVDHIETTPENQKRESGDAVLLLLPIVVAAFAHNFGAKSAYYASSLSYRVFGKRV
jgi:hypothetical protein